MKKWLLFFLLFAQKVSAQTIDHLSLGEAYDLARKNYPAIKQKGLVQQTENITIDNLQKGYLPQFTVTGQASYQSDVTSLVFTVPGINVPTPAKDQYRAVADASQIVYDGGIIRQQKVTARLNADVQQQQVEVELYQLKNRINQVYLGVLFIDAEVRQTDVTRNDVLVGIKQVEVQVNNGVAFKSNLDLLKAQLLTIDQHVIELKATRMGLIQSLALFLNQPLSDTILLERPVVEFTPDSSISRPELQLYDNQSQFLLHQNKLVTAKNLPKASLFAEGGYSRPGLNLLKNQFEWFYLGGIRLNWPLGGLYTMKKEKELNEVNKRSVDVEKETFLLNTSTQLRAEESEISKYRQLVGTDQAIIDLRTQVKKASLAQLENGVITANDYLREVNNEDLARQSMIVHQVQLLQAIINYQTTLGKQ